MTELPSAERDALSGAFDMTAPSPARVQVSADGTAKHLWRMADGELVESVLIPSADRLTLCISSQAGCAMACAFCATGWSGYRRNLTAGEIVAQYRGARRWAEENGAGAISNIVYMGMGEPLMNRGPVMDSLTILNQAYDVGARRITVSTVGIVPGIRRLAAEDLSVSLAVSLHAADDALRDELVPINKRYPLSTLMDACAGYLLAKGRRLSFEWALIDGVNDRDVDADLLVERARSLPLPAHVNLIPLNPTPGYAVRGTPMRRVRAFRDRLQAGGVNATIRRTRGTDIDAACGQLRADHELAVPTTPRRR